MNFTNVRHCILTILTRYLNRNLQARHPCSLRLYPYTFAIAIALIFVELRMVTSTFSKIWSTYLNTFLGLISIILRTGQTPTLRPATDPSEFRNYKLTIALYVVRNKYFTVSMNFWSVFNKIKSNIQS